jgi:poly(3-hydroxybutyrate) depolymerase
LADSFLEAADYSGYGTLDRDELEAEATEAFLELDQLGAKMALSGRTSAAYERALALLAGDESLTADSTGLLYTPPSCTAGAACKLIVALHGCLSRQSYLGNLFPELGNLDTYADTNHLVVLYPQAVPSVTPVNPQGCWDWWGYDGSNFAVKSAPQMVSIVNMVHALGG